MNDIDKIIDDIYDDYLRKYSSIDEISDQMKELGLTFVAQDWQIKGMFEQFIADLDKIRNHRIKENNHVQKENL